VVNIVNSWVKDPEKFNSKNIELPKFDRDTIHENGKKNPKWIHFGGGNIYRAMHAEIAQNLLNNNEMDTGVILVESFDEELIPKVYKKFDNKILQVIMKENGELKKRLLDSTSDSIYLTPQITENWKQITEYFENPSLQFITLSITEKGYKIYQNNESFIDIVEQDLKNGPDKPIHTMSILTSLLFNRFKKNRAPIAMVSTDNFSKNGQYFYNSIIDIAKSWLEKGYVNNEFINYLSNPEEVSFPWTMIDRITPTPSKNVLNTLINEGISDLELITTSKGSKTAPFVNTEEVNYLVMEDSFPNGRPDLSIGGVILTNRNTVDKTDAMKVTTCLNPLHTALAIYGCLLDFDSISDEMNDFELSKLVKKIGYKEGLPVVEDPEIINPKKFIDEVVNKRLPNPYIPDTPQRIVTDTSQKLPIRFGETIKKYEDRNDLSTEDLEFIPLVLAGWIRYLMGIDDNGKEFELSPDPLLKDLSKITDQLKFNMSEKEIESIVKPILINKYIFGVDLYKVNLADKVVNYLKQLLNGNGAVRETLSKYLNN